MKIRIKADDTNVELSDDGYNVPGFMDIHIGEEGEKESFTVEGIFITDLYTAVKALKDKYFLGLKKDKLL